MPTADPSQTNGIIVICTKNRPKEIETSCTTAHVVSPHLPILIIDASTTEATRNVCENISRKYGQSLDLIYRRASQPGLARQRNEAVDICRHLGVNVVHFIDDDTEVMPGYFDALEHRFQQEPSVIGLGGVILNQPEIHFMTIKSFFLLVSHRRGSVLRSGRNMPGQYPGTKATDSVEWLTGCSMSFRMSVFDKEMFDSHLQGYSMGEDYDFTFRVSRKNMLAVEPSATCIHHMTPTMRSSVRTLSRQRTEATHRWVNRTQGHGYVPSGFLVVNVWRFPASYRLWNHPHEG